MASCRDARRNGHGLRKVSRDRRGAEMMRRLWGIVGRAAAYKAGFASVDFSGFARLCLCKVPCFKGEVIGVMLRESAITNVSAFAQNPTTVFVDHQRKSEMVSFFVHNFDFYIANLLDCENRRGHLLLSHDEMFQLSFS